MAREDVDGADLFALVGPLVWVHDQPAFVPRGDHLFGLVTSAIMKNQTGSNATAALGTRSA